MRRTAVLLSTVGLSFFAFTGTSFADDAYPPQEPTTTVQQLPPPPTTAPPQYCPPCPSGSTTPTTHSTGTSTNSSVSGQYGGGHGSGGGTGGGSGSSSNNCSNGNGGGSGSGSGGSSTYNCPTALPTTGADSSSTLQIAGVAFISGIGLLGVAARRRKPARVTA